MTGGAYGVDSWNHGGFFLPMEIYENLIRVKEKKMVEFT